MGIGTLDSRFAASAFPPSTFGPTPPAPSRALWPLQALASWTLAWAAFLGLQRGLGADAAAALVGASLVGLAAALFATTAWRRLIVALGFPLSALAAGGAALPAWAWLLPLALLALAYPWRAWRDAPFFPTPEHALDQLDRLAPLPSYARVLDAGCGLGHGLAALARAYPRVLLEGIEWSAPLAWAAHWRCRLHGPKARIARGDMWAADWSPYALVYLFQRPESLPRAVAKAGRELQAGAWLASLEFEAEGLVAQARSRSPDGRRVWLYRAPFVRHPAR